MVKRELLIGLLLVLTLSAMGQKRKPVTMTPEQQEQKDRMERMVRNTQRILFIDSMVVPKELFLQYYRLSEESGRIARFQDLFHSQKQPHAYAHVNGLGNCCLLSQETADSTMNLYASEMIDNRWSRPTLLRGINDDGQFSRVNYPFMMGDGLTLYFAAEGGDGLGGYDIYVTRRDQDDGHFLHPANIGMPFNSEANDYMYAIDEYNDLGWFATDRHQSADSVCIYVFQPTKTRQTYAAAGLAPAEIVPFAHIQRIADTWTDTQVLSGARQRLKEVRQPHTANRQDSGFQFVVNDDITYTRITDFKANGNAERYKQLTRLKGQYQRLTATLGRAREYFATAGEEERNELRTEILASEQKQHELFVQAHDLEKTIRNAEITFLTKEK